MARPQSTVRAPASRCDEPDFAIFCDRMRILGILLSCLAASCSSPGQAFTTLPAEDILIVAHATTSGDVSAVEILEPGDARSFDLRDAVAVVFSLAPTEFRLVDSATKLVGEPVSAGSGCARCLVPTQTPPMILYPGSRCVLPAATRSFAANADGADSETSIELVDRIRVAIRVGADGLCASKPIHRLERPDPAKLTVTPLGDPLLRRPAQATVIASDGTVAELDLEFARLTLPSGAVAERLEVPFRRRVIWAVPMGSSFLVVSETNSELEPADFPGRARFDLFERDLSWRLLETAPEVGGVVDVRRVFEVASPELLRSWAPNFEPRVWLTGRALGNRASRLYLCGLSATMLGPCAEVGQGTSFVGSVLGVSPTPGDGLVVLDSSSALSYGVVSDRGERWVQIPMPRSDPKSLEPEGLIEEENVLRLCGADADGPYVLSATLAVEDPAATLWKVIDSAHRAPEAESDCRLTQDEQGLWVSWNFGLFQELTPRDELVDSARFNAAIPEGRTITSFRTSGGRALVRDDCNGSYVVTSSSTLTLADAPSCANRLAVDELGNLHRFGDGFEELEAPDGELIKTQVPVFGHDPFSVALDDSTDALWISNLEDTFLVRSGAIQGRTGDPESVLFSVGPGFTAALVEGRLWRLFEGTKAPLSTSTDLIAAASAGHGVLWAIAPSKLIRFVALGDETVVTEVPFPEQDLTPASVAVLDRDHVAVVSGIGLVTEVSAEPDDAWQVKEVMAAQSTPDWVFRSGDSLVGISNESRLADPPKGMAEILAVDAIRSLTGLSDFVEHRGAGVALVNGRLLKIERAPE